MEPNAIYLHFDLGSDAGAHRQLFDLLVQLGGAPTAQPGCTISLPINLKKQLADYGLPSLRLLDELDVEPCSVELRRVIAHAREDGTIRTGDRVEPSAWTAVAAGYQPSCPNRVDLRQIVTIPKRANGTPIAAPPSWSMVAERFCSTKPVNGNTDIAALFRRESAKAASLFKKAGADDIDISMVLEQVIACWTGAFQPTEENSYRVSVKRWTGVPDRSLPNIVEVHSRIYEKREDRNAIVADMEPFRRVALKQGLQPLVMGFGLVSFPVKLTVQK